jgi:hypothetical protein
MLTPWIAEQHLEVVTRLAAGAGDEEPIAPKTDWADSFDEVNPGSFISVLNSDNLSVIMNG